MRTRASLALALAIAAAGNSAALEIKDGLMKVVLHESSGRYTVYYLVDPAKSRYEPLVFDRDPRTSSLNVYIDGRLYRMGESSDFKAGSRKNGSGADFVFKSPACTVTENFTFMKSKGSEVSDGVRVSVTVENSSDRDLSVGARAIVDSHLGESLGGHFSTNLRPRIAAETRIDASTKDEWLLSAPAGEGKPGLLVPMPASGLTRADSVILANWSRRNSSAWDFELSPSRNFTLQPYSINDSAIALEWRVEKLRPATARSFSYIVAGSTDSGALAFSSKPGSIAPAYDAADGSAPRNGSAANAVETSAPLAVRDDEKTARAKSDYASLAALLKRIDALISSGQAPTASELAELRSRLKELQAAQSRL